MAERKGTPFTGDRARIQRDAATLPHGKCYCGSLRLLGAVLRAFSHQEQIFEFHIMTYFELPDFCSELSGDSPSK